MNLLVTFETYTAESVKDGDTDSNGFVDPAGYTAEVLSPQVDSMGWTVREAVDRFRSSVDHAERSGDSVYGLPGSDFWLDRWLTELPCSAEMIGAQIAVHRPHHGMTDAAWQRICNLLGAAA